MSGQPEEQSHHEIQRPHVLRAIVVRLWPLAIGAVLVLFPFDWPGNIWPAYQQIFERVFVGAREHHIGHSTLFFIVGLISKKGVRSSVFTFDPKSPSLRPLVAS
jgi:hypothetical protein